MTENNNFNDTDNKSEESNNINNIEDIHSENNNISNSLDVQKKETEDIKEVELNNTGGMYNQMPSDPYYLRVGFGKRLLAYLLDVLIFCAIFFVVLTIFTDITNEINILFKMSNDLSSLDAIEEFTNIIENTMIPISLLLGVIYYSTEVFFAASPGKKIVGICIGSDNNKAANIKQLLLRFLIKNISTVFSVLYISTKFNFFNLLGTFLGLVVSIGFFGVLFERKQALHDILAKTAVYEKSVIKSNNE